MSQFQNQKGGGGGRGGSGGKGDGGGKGGGGKGDQGGRGGGGGKGGGGKGGDQGGGRGGGGKGGGGKGGGGGGGGGNKHMGQIDSVVMSSMRVERGSGMSNAEILEIVRPSASERASRESRCTSSTCYMPPVEEWRYSPSVGLKLNPANIVSNHFLVNVRNIPERFFHYHVHIYSFDSHGTMNPEDIASKEDFRITVELMSQFRDLHPEFSVIRGQKVGYVYDNRSSVVTTHELPLTETNKTGEPCVSNDIHLLNKDGSPSRRHFLITLSFVKVVGTPINTTEGWSMCTDASVIRSLDLSLLAFARTQVKNENPSWYVVGSKCFSEQADKFPVAPAYVALRGYTVGLKSCLAGLTLVSDMTVSVFLSGGPLLNMVYDICGFNTFESFIQHAQKNGIHQRDILNINKTLKNTKIRLDHLGHSKKFKSLGPPANHSSSAFEKDGKKITVAKYFEEMAKVNLEYKRCMRGNTLRFPFLPTINVGSATKPILAPMELVTACYGQNFSSRCTGEMTAKVVRHAAILPQERFQSLIDSANVATQNTQSVIKALREDAEAKAFGVVDFELSPMRVASKLLPPPKLQYKNDVKSPGLSGEWNILTGKPVQFVNLPPRANQKGAYTYGILLVSQQEPRDWEADTKNFQKELEKVAATAGLKLETGGAPLTCSDRPDQIKQKAAMMMQHGARILVVLLMSDSYGAVKLATDSMGLMTQCVKWKTVTKNPRGLHMNVVIKINTKMGGTNHTLASQLSLEEEKRAPKTFQNPPSSLSWIFDKPCMLVGIDTSHPEPGTDRKTVAAVVGSINGQASQYAAHISAQAPRVEIVTALTEAMVSLLTTFRNRNSGKFPEHIIVYRDGVGDGQFDEVLTHELASIQQALAEHGRLECKIAFIICQKRHNTRLAYQEKPGQYINCCPGLCIDASGKENSISSAVYNEFYLNSHTAIQGTAKSCKYSLIYDDIGMKMSEIELLTYWTCYLYARCNRSVSYATPAYYAHWASRRAKNLFAAGAEGEDLDAITRKWSETGRDSTMFFV